MSKAPDKDVDEIVEEIKVKEKPKAKPKKTAKPKKSESDLFKQQAQKKMSDRRTELFKAHEILQKNTKTKNSVIMRPNNPLLRIKKIPFLNRYRLNELTQGGVPIGKISLLWGDEGTGKTTTAKIIASSAQRMCRYCDIPLDLDYSNNPHGDIKGCSKCGNNRGYSILWIDTECAFDEEYARRFGVITDENESDLFVFQPDTAENAENTLEVLIQQGIDMVIIDSVANLTPKSDIMKDSEDSKVVAGRANIINSMITKLLNTMKNVEFAPTTILVNQARLEIKTGYSRAPAQKYPPGGMFQKFACSMSIFFAKAPNSKRHYNDDTKQLLKKDLIMQVVKSKVCKETDRVDIPINLGTPGVHWGYMDENIALFKKIKPFITGGGGKYSILNKMFRTHDEIKEYLYTIDGQKEAESFVKKML